MKHPKTREQRKLELNKLLEKYPELREFVTRPGYFLSIPIDRTANLDDLELVYRDFENRNLPLAPDNESC